MNSSDQFPGPWQASAPAEVIERLRLMPSDHLENGTAVDVIVIGGGVSGLSAAAACARRGAQVLLLEKSERLGAGASGRNAGIMCGGVNMPLTHVQEGTLAEWLWIRTTQLLQEMFTEAARPNTLLLGRRTGSLFLAKTKTAANRVAAEVREFEKIGIKAELLAATDVDKKSGGMLNTSEVEAALHLPDEGRMHPWTLLAHLAKDATDASARLIGNAEVTQREYVSREKRWKIRLSSNKVLYAGRVVQCIGPLVNPTSRIYAMSFELDLPLDFPVFQDAAPYVYYDYRPGDGFITVSGGRYGRAGNSKPDKKYLANMAEAAKYWMPCLKSTKPVFEWAVDLNVAPDMIPALTELEDGPGYRIEGLGALGVLPGIALGQLAAEILVGECRLEAGATIARKSGR